MSDVFTLSDNLARHGQQHLLEGVDALDEASRDIYLARLAAIDWEELAHPCDPVAIESVGASRVIDDTERAERADALATAGEAAMQAGKVAVLMVAGGQGTRLGFSGPKGCYEIGAHSGKSIYQLQAEKVLSLSRRLGKEVPFLIMTSPMTDEESRDFFAVHSNFGLSDDQVRFFSQGTVPSLDQDGKGLLKAPGHLLENPDGHGGCFTALVASGQLARLKDEGVTQLIYIQVDNILAPVDDAVLVGLAETEQTDIITKVLEKAHPDEKVGHLVKIGDRDRIVEYTEVTPEQTRMTNDAGELIYRWGSPAMHCWSIAFLSGLAETNFKPPLHRSAKPLKAYVGGDIVEVKGWKSERFIFDLIPEAPTSMGLVLNRLAEFAPVKNAEGTDSAISARQLASDEYVRWLEAAGVDVSLGDGQLVEISPLFAATKEQFLTNWDGQTATIRGDFYLEEKSQ